MLIPYDNKLERFEHTTIEVVPVKTLREALDRMLLREAPALTEPAALPAAAVFAEKTASGRA